MGKSDSQQDLRVLYGFYRGMTDISFSPSSYSTAKSPGPVSFIYGYCLQRETNVP
jgi:hypothetical protein